ncbi:MAG: heavy metal-responsive transcriptional regulator [Phototrophicales bacterium]|nr:MAG: heavy metal-responsive transcriptional regulator [Phototrophicales bacterium]
MYKIGELSQASGISRETIRYYESVGIMPPAPRASNGYRIYNDADLERLKFIKKARLLGFSLKDIVLMLDDDSVETMPICEQVLSQLAHQAEMILMRIHYLQSLHNQIQNIIKKAQQLPIDVNMKDCVCGLIKQIELEENEVYDERIAQNP